MIRIRTTTIAALIVGVAVLCTAGLAGAEGTSPPKAGPSRSRIAASAPAPSADRQTVECFVRAVSPTGAVVAVWVAHGDSTQANGGCPDGAIAAIVVTQYRLAGGSETPAARNYLCGHPVATPYGNGYTNYYPDTSVYGAWGCAVGDVHIYDFPH